MAERPDEQQNWQLRQYDSFGPHFRIDTEILSWGQMVLLFMICWVLAKMETQVQ